MRMKHFTSFIDDLLLMYGFGFMCAHIIYTYEIVISFELYNLK